MGLCGQVVTITRMRVLGRVVVRGSGVAGSSSEQGDGVVVLSVVVEVQRWYGCVICRWGAGVVCAVVEV